MKKRWYIFVSLILCAAMLVGCGSQNSAPAVQSENRTEEQVPEQTTEATNLPTEEADDLPTGYQTTYVEVKDDKLTATIQNVTPAGDGVYFTSLGVLADETPDGVTPEWPEQYWVYGPVLCKTVLDGSVERIPYQPSADHREGNGNSGVVFERICSGEENTVWILENHFQTWNDAPEGMSIDDPEYDSYARSEEEYFLVCVDQSGQGLKSFALNQIGSHAGEAAEADGSYSLNIPGMAMDADGNICIAVSEWFVRANSYGEENKIIVLDTKTGEISQVFTMGSAPEYLVALSDGRIATAYYEGAKPMIGLLDFKDQNVTDAVAVDGFLNIMVSGPAGKTVCYGTGDSFFSLDPDSGEIQKLLDWTACDVARSGEESICVQEDGRIVTTTSKESADGIKNEMIILAPGRIDQAEKKVLHMAVMNLYPFTSAMISRFNRSSTEYRIEVKDYAQYNDYSSANEADWNAGLTRLQTEIIAGDVPDILDISLLSANQLGAKGLLTDLYPYLDEDPELDRNQLNEHVLAAFEENGKLYQTVGNFYILTTAGLSSVVGEKEGWTMEQFRSAMQNLQREHPDSTVFDIYTTRSDILTFLLYLEMGNFVDWESGECKFETQSFVDFLEFVKGFPTSFDWQGENLTPSDLDQDGRLLLGVQLMKQCNFACFEDVQTNTIGLRDVPCTFVGYPTESGCGSMFAQIGNSFAISSGCIDKDAAWQFVRMFFLPDYQEQFLGYVFPSNLSVYEQMKQDSMAEQYQRNPDGSYTVDSEGKRIKKDRGSVVLNGISYPYQEVTEEEIALIEKLIDNTTHVLKTDSALKDIILNGSAAFFSGQSTAEEAARQIQSRANIYINEQK